MQTVGFLGGVSGGFKYLPFSPLGNMNAARVKTTWTMGELLLSGSGTSAYFCCLEGVERCWKVLKSLSSFFKDSLSQILPNCQSQHAGG